MRLVLDNNILFSLMKPFSINSFLFSSLKAEFCAPEFIKSELNKYRDDCLSKSRLSEHEFEIRQAGVEKEIKFFESREYKDFIKESLSALPDPDDADFLALALSIKAAIWSNDPHLKIQPLVRVFTTKELAEKLLSGEI